VSRRCALAGVAAVVLASLAPPLVAETTAPADLSQEAVVSGLEFVTAETRALQEDTFANPGLLWVDRGRALFEETGEAPACRECHENGLAGAYTRYPQHDTGTGTLLSLDDRINLCRSNRQQREPLAADSDELLALSMYVASLSNGMPYQVAIDGKTRPYFEQGRAYFFQHRGQLNLACHHCHDQNWGKKLRGDTISQGQPTAFPGYRLEWQSAGPLHRRFRDCDVGVRAEPHALGSDVYKALELYLAWRAGGLPIEVPGVRR
jgi:sulfur-oxidizing protein SoxA